MIDFLPWIYLCGVSLACTLGTISIFLIYLTQPKEGYWKGWGYIDGYEVIMGLILLWFAAAWVWPVVIPIGLCWWVAVTIARNIRQPTQQDNHSERSS